MHDAHPSFFFFFFFLHFSFKYIIIWVPIHLFQETKYQEIKKQNHISDERFFLILLLVLLKRNYIHWKSLGITSMEVIPTTLYLILMIQGSTYTTHGSNDFFLL